MYHLPQTGNLERNFRKKKDDIRAYFGLCTRAENQVHVSDFRFCGLGPFFLVLC